MAIVNVYKCPVCGESINQRKIALHLWNLHKVKYKEYVSEHGELEIVGTEEVADQKKPEKKEIAAPVVESAVETVETVEKVEKPVNKPVFDREDRLDVSQLERLDKAEDMGLRSWVSDEGENIVINEWC